MDSNDPSFGFVLCIREHRQFHTIGHFRHLSPPHCCGGHWVNSPVRHRQCYRLSLGNSGLLPRCKRCTKRSSRVLKTVASLVFLFEVMRYFPSTVTARPRGATPCGRTRRTTLNVFMSSTLIVPSSSGDVGYVVGTLERYIHHEPMKKIETRRANCRTLFVVSTPSKASQA